MIPLFGRFERSLQRLPISRKILAVSAISSFATLSLICVISVLRDRAAFAESRLRELSVLSRIMEANTIAALRFDDAYRAKEYADSFQFESEIESVTIYKANGQVFARYQRNGSDAAIATAPDFQGEKWTADTILYAREISLDGKLLGKILIEMSTRSLHEALIQSLWIASALLLGGLAITLLLSARLQSLISNPIRELVDVTRSITERKDFSERARKRYQDEIGSLVDSFNEMLEAIGKRDAALREANSSLEKTVEERTEDLRKQNADLQDAIQAAKAASVAKTEFLATTSHELRTPLNPIIGYVDMLLREKPNASDAHKLRLIKSSAQQLLRLIEDILDFSRIERGAIKMGSEALDPVQLCSELVDLMSTESDKKGIALRFETTANPASDASPLWIAADAGRLRQVILNLIGNAVKFTQEGSVTVRLSFPKRSDSNYHLRIEVEDTGIGIAEKDQRRLFVPFSQVDSGWSREYRGMGLGLAISKKIVDAMNGRMDFRSELGKGSCFSFEIPIKIQTPPDKTTSAPPQKRPSELNYPEADEKPDGLVEEPGPGLPVLVVEDEAVNRELMSALLIGLGYEVVTARNGIVALELVGQQDFALMLLDISMPKLDGMQTAKIIREREKGKRRTPIVTMTAHATPDDRERCIAAGADDYMAKPVSFTKLKKVLKKWIPYAQPDHVDR